MYARTALGVALAAGALLMAAAPAHAASEMFDLSSRPGPGDDMVMGCSAFSILMLTHVGASLVMPFSSTHPNLAFAIDAKTGVHCYRNRDGRAETPGLTLVPELGYSFTSQGPLSTHLARVGVGVGYGNIWASVTYAPRLVFGTRSGGELPGTALGLRHGIVAHLLLDMLGVDLSHQVLSTGGQIENDLRAMLSINVGVLLVAAAYAHR